jgi:hypothetical protein
MHTLCVASVRARRLHARHHPASQAGLGLRREGFPRGARDRSLGAAGVERALGGRCPVWPAAVMRCVAGATRYAPRSGGNVKSDALFAMVQELLARGVPIHVVRRSSGCAAVLAGAACVLRPGSTRAQLQCVGCAARSTGPPQAQLRAGTGVGCSAGALATRAARERYRGASGHRVLSSLCACVWCRWGSAWTWR